MTGYFLYQAKMYPGIHIDFSGNKNEANPLEEGPEYETLIFPLNK